RIDKDDLPVSVRDYHTLNVLSTSGVRCGLMTGCPATYDLEYVGSSSLEQEEICRVAFSLGVAFLYSKSLKKQMESAILSTKALFPNAKFEVVFHHGTTESFLKTPSAKKEHLIGHQKFITWLQEKGVDYVDISGSAENLIEYYSQCDLHIGYRVHAHIFMNSISKPSVLVAEDGRGKALRDVFGGLVLDAFDSVGMGIVARIIRRLRIFDTFHTSENLVSELSGAIEYEINNGLPRISPSRGVIDSNF
ncbi:polysaccharide pyruvyl transferase family protein, partial [Oleiphilus sp. HI0043]|uniref:polysaccharide pyruvyl transferase family protein n=2 Tax=Oleiphilus TaxID=141450 RepID=UPI000ADBABC8